VTGAELEQWIADHQHEDATRPRVCECDDDGCGGDCAGSIPMPAQVAGAADLAPRWGS